MASVSISQVLLAVFWSIVIWFICNVGSDVFDHAPPSDCDFCAIVNETLKVRVLNETDSLIAFKSKEPDCTKHYLIIPKDHIKNIYSAEVNCSLVTHMQDICNEMLDRDGITYERRMLFHNPPFYSVKHLHLHCMACSVQDNSYLSVQHYINQFHMLFSPDLSHICPI
jgi:sulfate adenylyltransferase (ADP) / adenylylsulfatase